MRRECNSVSSIRFCLYRNFELSLFFGTESKTGIFLKYPLFTPTHHNEHFVTFWLKKNKYSKYSHSCEHSRWKIKIRHNRRNRPKGSQKHYDCSKQKKCNTQSHRNGVQVSTSPTKQTFCSDLLQWMSPGFAIVHLSGENRKR